MFSFIDVLLYDFWCPGMICYYVKSQMQDSSEQCSPCIKFISGKIHEALKAWVGTQDTSTLNQNIPGSNPNLGSTSQPSRPLCYFLVWWN